MPDATINRTPAGWPYLDQNNFIDVIDDYTVDLANKLDAGYSGLAAAVNAAATVSALSAGTPYTPTITASTNPTLGAREGRELRLGKLVVSLGRVEINGVGSGLYSIAGFPTSQRSWQWLFGTGVQGGSGTQRNFGLGGNGAGSFGLYGPSGRLGSADFVAGSVILYCAIYEAA